MSRPGRARSSSASPPRACVTRTCRWSTVIGRPLPMVLGHEAAGTVEEVGPGVTEVSVGDCVVCSYVPSCGRCDACASAHPVLCPEAQSANREARLVSGRRPFSDTSGPLHHHLGVSAFSELTVLSPRSLVKVPDDVPLEIAAVFGCAVLTGVGAVLNTAGARPGGSAVVFGLGGVGLSAVMAAALSGAYPVVGVDTVDGKLAVAQKVGATHTFLADDGTARKIRELTGGGATWAIEAAGSPVALSAAYKATRPGGTVVAAGLPDPRHTLDVPIASLVGEEKTVRGSYMGSSVPRRDLPRLFDLHRRGRLPVEALVTASDVTLDDVNTALDRLHSGAEVRQIIRPGS